MYCKPMFETKRLKISKYILMKAHESKMRALL